MMIDNTFKTFGDLNSNSIVYAIDQSGNIINGRYRASKGECVFDGVVFITRHLNKLKSECCFYTQNLSDTITVYSDKEYLKHRLDERICEWNEQINKLQSMIENTKNILREL